jgi:hypothetical protein
MLSGYMCPCCPHLLQSKPPPVDTPELHRVPLYSLDPGYLAPAGIEPDFRARQKMGKAEAGICRMGYAWPGSATVIVESGKSGGESVWFTGHDVCEQQTRALAIFDVTHEGEHIFSFLFSRRTYACTHTHLHPTFLTLQVAMPFSSTTTPRDTLRTLPTRSACKT